MEKQTIIVGQMDNTQDHTYESANRIYSGGYFSNNTYCVWWRTFAKGSKKVEKKIIILGDLEVGGQRGRIIGSGGGTECIKCNRV